MKSAKLIASLLLIVCSMSFFSCTKQNILSTDTTDILTQGQWKVDYYFSDQDHTAQLANYNFQFAKDGSLFCSDGNTVYSGAWKIIRNVNQSDLLQISMTPVNSDLQQLSLNWKVSEVSFQTIGLRSEGTTPFQLHMEKQ